MQFSERAVYLTVGAEDIEDFRMPVVTGCTLPQVHVPCPARPQSGHRRSGLVVVRREKQGKFVMTLCAGDWVEIRSKDEILATLDRNGRLDGLPFMPQMFKWCGQQFKVHKRAHKTCDTVTGDYVGRLLPNGIHLDLRCDGQAYEGCQAACLIFWKEAWLKPVTQDTPASAEPRSAAGGLSSGCTEADVLQGTKAPDQPPGSNIRYICQATELLNYTQPLKWWDARQYVEDFASGNNSLPRMLRGFLYFGFLYVTNAKRRTVGRPARWLYDRIQSLWGGAPFPRRTGLLVSGKDAPLANLALKPGDVVRVRSYQDILATIDAKNQNRGMGFDAEMVPYCGKLFRVKTRVEKFVDERNGYIRRMKTPAVILDGVYCRSHYSESRLFCPREIYAWWREVWLEKVDSDLASSGVEQTAKHA